MNNINLIGRLTNDVEVKYSKQRKAYCNFSLAVNYNKDETDFINCTAFDKIAENIAEYVIKGNNLAVSGTLRQGKYIKDNKEYSYHYVLVGKITFIEKKQQKEKSKSKNDFMDIPDELPFN